MARIVTWNGEKLRQELDILEGIVIPRFSVTGGPGDFRDDVYGAKVQDCPSFLQSASHFQQRLRSVRGIELFPKENPCPHCRTFPETNPHYAGCQKQLFEIPSGRISFLRIVPAVSNHSVELQQPRHGGKKEIT